MICEGLKTVGLCGRSGSGKGYVSKAFALYGVLSVDTDAVYRDITDGGACPECVSELVSYFGDKIVDCDGRLLRRELSKIVFAGNNSEKLKKLNSITHKYILYETMRRAYELKKAGAKAVIIDAPLLFESNFDYYCDIKIFVSCPEELSVERICERDGISPFEAKRRLANQMSNERLSKLCDIEIVNDGKNNIIEIVKDIVEKYEL